MALCGDNDLVCIVDDGLRLVFLHSVDHDLGTKLGMFVAKAGKSADAVQAVGRREYLDSQPLCVLDHEPPHANHHGVMKACINIVDQKESSSCLEEIQDKNQVVSQASSKSSKRQSTLGILEFQENVGRRSSPTLMRKASLSMLGSTTFKAWVISSSSGVSTKASQSWSSRLASADSAARKFTRGFDSCNVTEGEARRHRRDCEALVFLLLSRAMTPKEQGLDQSFLSRSTLDLALDPALRVTIPLDPEGLSQILAVAEEEMGWVRDMPSELLRRLRPPQDPLSSSRRASHESLNPADRHQLGCVKERSLPGVVQAHKEIDPRQRLDAKLSEAAEPLYLQTS